MADVTFTFGGDATSLQQAFEDIKKELGKTKEAVSGLSTQFAMAFTAIQGAISAVKTALDFISNIPAQASRVEDLRVTFAQLTGDARQAGELLHALWHDAANGSVSLEAMAAAAKPLLHVFADNKSIREWTNRFADMATGSGVAADQLSKLFARALTLGKVDSRSIDTLAKQGIPIYQELAAVVGTTSDAIQSMVKKGVVSADQYAAALRNMTNEGGIYYRLSSQLSNTTSGSWGTLAENVNRLAAKLGEPINDAVTPLLQSVSGQIEQALPQVEAFARSLGEMLDTGMSAAGILLSDLGSVLDALGGLKTVLASVAAGLLMYSGNARQAATSTAAVSTQAAVLDKTFKGLSVSSVVASLKSGLAAVASAFRSTLAGLRASLTATLAGMKMAWSVAWSTMAAVTRAAMVAVKTAIVSTGIGLLIVGIGEALGALYSWFMSDAEAAKQATDSARQFERALKDISKQADKVKSYEQMDSFMESLQERIDDLRAQREEAYTNEEWERGDQLTRQLDTLWKQEAHYKKALPLQIEKARVAEREAAAIRAQAEAAAALEKKLEEAGKKMTELVAQQRLTEREQYLGSLSYPQQISLRLADAGGFQSLDELREAMRRMEIRGLMDERDVERYKTLADTYNKVVELRRKEAEKATQTAKEEKKKQEEEVQKQQTLEEARQAYEAELAMLRAGTKEDEKRLELLKQQQCIVQLTAEYQRKGFSAADAADKARRLVQAELSAEIAREQREARRQQTSGRMSATWIQDSRAAVGGGGSSYLLGVGPMLVESKKHTALLKEVRDAVKQSPQIKVSGNVDAVIGK